MSFVDFYKAVYIVSSLLELLFIVMFVLTIIFYATKLATGNLKYGDDVRSKKAIDIPFYGTIVFFIMRLALDLLAPTFGIKL